MTRTQHQSSDDDLAGLMMRLTRTLVLTRQRLFATPHEEMLPIQLLFVMHKLGPRRSGEYAAALKADPSTVSRQVAQLVRMGLVRREADPADGRATHLVLTESGAHRLESLKRTVDEVFAGVVADWSDHDTAEFTRLIAQYLESFDQHGEALVHRLTAELVVS